MARVYKVVKKVDDGGLWRQICHSVSANGVRREDAVCSRQLELRNGFILISACNNEQAGIEIAGGQRDREVIGILIGCYKEHLCISYAVFCLKKKNAIIIFIILNNTTACFCCAVIQIT